MSKIFTIKEIICKTCSNIFKVKQVKTLECPKCKNRRHNKKYYLKNKERCKKRQKEYRENNVDKVKDTNSKYYINNREALLEKSRKEYKANSTRITRKSYLKQVMKPLEEWECNIKGGFKKQARHMLRRAIQKGRIIKPSKCSDCNKVFPKFKIHGHHTDYSKWWDVIWLCEKCHKKVHREDKDK
jgi:hypothetical protein